MRAILIGLLLVGLASTQALGQELQKKAVAIKADFGYFEDDWGMRVKSYSADLVTVRSKTGEPMVVGQITYVLGFEKNIINQDLDTIQAIFTDKSRRLRHIFFDQENIALTPFVVFGYQIQGEISGVKGEAIRLVVEIEYDAAIIMQKAKKLVVRPN